MPARPRMHTSLRTTILSGIALILSATILVPSSPAQDNPEPIALQDGSWALQFRIGPNFDLSSRLGSTISAKYHVSAHRAWQFGVTLAGSTEDTEIDVAGQNTPETVGQGFQRVAVTARYLAYPLLDDAGSERVQMFVGAGPRLQFLRTTATLNEGEANEESRTNVAWGAGLSGVLGVEWFVTPRISLDAAYVTSLLYERETDSQEDARPGAEDVDATTDRFRLNSGGGRLGVSVYF